MNNKKNFMNNTIKKPVKNNYDLLLEENDDTETKEDVIYDLNLEYNKNEKNVDIVVEPMTELDIKNLDTSFRNNENSKWKKQEKRHNKFYKKKTKRIPVTISDELKEKIENITLSSNWNVWVHSCSDTNWDLESYKIIHVIKDIKTFWLFVGNLINLDYDNYQYYIMREHSCPTWEHPSNSNGGTCSIRFLKDKLLDIVEQLSILIITDNFNNKPEEINGISFGTKTHWGLIKIWTSDGNNDVSVYVPNYMTKLYSMTNKYKYNEPKNTGI